MKAEFDKLVINEFVNVLSGLKTELKSIPIDLKKLSNVVREEVVKYNECNTLNMKVNNLEKTIPDAATLIQTNQYNSEKQNLEKKNWTC